jgi:AcrR family transcriptional regulator
MPRTEEAKQQIRDAQRANIIEAARRVFARKGLAATMDDVAAEAGVSHGLAYRYFASKNAIFKALVEQDLQQAARLQPLVMSASTPGERLNFLVTQLVESRRHPEMHQLLTQVLSDDDAPPGLREMVHAHAEAVQCLMRQLIVEGQSAGEVVAGDPDQLVRAIFACLEGLTRWATYYPDRYAEHYPGADIFLRMLKP